MAKARKPKAGTNRAIETRDPKSVIKPEITFSFKYFSNIEGPGQSLESWATNNCKLLQGLVEKMIHLSEKNTATIAQDPTFTRYGSFPSGSNTDFTCPLELEDRNWGVIRNVGGQKARVAGFLEENIFYIVFFDAEHKFWKSEL